MPFDCFHRSSRPEAKGGDELAKNIKKTIEELEGIPAPRRPPCLEILKKLGIWVQLVDVGHSGLEGRKQLSRQPRLGD